MTTLSELAPKERLLLLRRVAQAWLERLPALAEKAGDEGYRLLQVAGGEHAFLEEIERINRRVPWPRVWHLSEGEIERLLREHVPSLWRSDSSPFELALAIEEEVGTFYRTLSETAVDPRSRKLFLRASSIEERHEETLKA